MNQDLEQVDAFLDQKQGDLHQDITMTCAGCNRHFCKKTNFEQHFFCPWRCDYDTRRKLRRTLGITPISYYEQIPIYTAEEFARYMSKTRRARRCYPRAWSKALDKFNKLSRLVQVNVYYYADDEISPYIVQLIKEPEIISGAFSKEQ